jgi:hypothetical protein
MLAFLLPVCLSCVAAPPQGGNQVSEIFPVQHLVGEAPQQPAPPWATLLERRDANVFLVGSWDASAAMSMETLLDVLQQLAGPATEESRLHLQQVCQSVLAVGEPQEVARVGERIRAIGAVVARPVQVEFAVWDAADRETCPPILDAAAFARFAGNRAPLAMSTTAARGGQSVSLQRLKWTRYVRDIDVEVAQKQSMTSPAVAEFGEGAHALVQVFGLLGDEMAVHAQFAVAQRRGIVRTLQTGMVGAADLELPTLETDYGGCSGRVGNGGALAITLRGNAASGGQRILTLRVQAGPLPAATPGLGFAVLPCGALCAEGMQRLMNVPDEGDGEVSWGCGMLEEIHVLELVRAGIGGEDVHGMLRAESGHLLVAGDDATLQRAERTLRGLQDRIVRNASIVHTGSLQPADAGAPAGPGALHELQAPTLLGRCVVLGRFLETNAITEINCAIAQEAGVLNPEVERVASGVWLCARVGQVDARAHLQLRLRNEYTPTPQARSVMPGGVLMATERAISSFTHDGLVDNDRPTAHGDGPAITIEGRGYRSALATTVRW